MDASLVLVQDRLENGDWIYDQKEGELRRKPVSMKDAGKLAMDAANLRAKMNIQENHTVAAEHVEDKLAKLAKAFSDLANGKKLELTQRNQSFLEFLIPFLTQINLIVL